jgi:hypothetical protein
MKKLKPNNLFVKSLVVFVKDELLHIFPKNNFLLRKLKHFRDGDY